MSTAKPRQREREILSPRQTEREIERQREREILAQKNAAQKEDTLSEVERYATIL